MIRFTVPFILAIGLSVPALAQPGQADRAPAMLLHGNYCGPGNNAPLAPIDALDAACAHHDACTPGGRLPSRACNTRLQRDAELVSRDPRQPNDLRALAGLVAAGAGILPSDTRLAAPVFVPGRVEGDAPAQFRPSSVTPEANELDDTNEE